MDDLYHHTLPAIMQHINNVAMGLALQTLDLDIPRHKWSLTVQGLKGQAQKEEDDMGLHASIWRMSTWTSPTRLRVILPHASYLATRPTAASSYV